MLSSNSSSPIHRKGGQPYGKTGSAPTVSADDVDYYHNDHEAKNAMKDADGGGDDPHHDPSFSMAADESKYGKRRHQKQKQRVKNTIALVLSALCILAFTFLRVPNGGSTSMGGGGSRNLVKSSSSIAGGDDDGEDDDDKNAASKQQRRLQQPQPRTKHRPREGGGGGSEGGETDRRGRKMANKRKKKRVQHQEFPHDDDSDDDGDEDDDSSGALGVGDDGSAIRNHLKMLEMDEALKHLDERIQSNANEGIRWVDPGLIPSLKAGEKKPMLEVTRHSSPKNSNQSSNFFHLKRRHKDKMAWEVEAKDTAMETDVMRSTFVDYTKHKYQYPEILLEPPVHLGDYPKLTPMKEIMETWNQDDLDNPPETIYEDLIHFDFTNPVELEAAAKFRDAKLPFKMVNVPEVVAAGKKWTDEYLASHFGTKKVGNGRGGGYGSDGPAPSGSCDESADNFFAFYVTPMWNVEKMGLPPTRKNDFTFEKWAEHAKYADKVGLNANQPHFYFQCGVPREERYEDEELWSFVSKDLPSFSSPSETFFVFDPDEQKGIQCRFGERGVVAATHYDTGRNMVAMMTGAKRYILSPPRECSKLGIVTKNGNPIFRHSMLNFGHLSYMDHTDMPKEEREWMELAGTAGAISTVLKAGEVLYIPSHWFHYIVSVQKSAQCNVRSGVDEEGDAVFGGADDVAELCEPAAILKAA